MEEVKKPRTSPLEFFKQVRQEAGKVVWPSRKETGVTTIIVFIMVIVSSLFFLAADFVISHGIRALLGL
jgi:preprotein translocase subunit SecE